MSKTSQKILILGAGIAGLQAAQNLSKKIGPQHKITLVDRSPVHVFRADVYEVATAFKKEITHECMTRLKDTVATPIKDLVDAKRVKFIRDSVAKIDPQKKTVILEKKGELKYDYLICTMGSEVNYFGISGMEKFSFALKDANDAVKINCALDQCVLEAAAAKTAKEINILIGGGGATGVETAAEFATSIKKLSKKYSYPIEKIKVHLIEGTARLSGMNPKITKRIKKRLTSLGVTLHQKRYITKVTKTQVTLQDRSKKLTTHPFNILIWTGGVKVNSIVAGSIGDPAKRGAIPVNTYLQSITHPSIFAAGDNSYFPDPQNPQQRLPMLGQLALPQGKILATNVSRLVRATKSQSSKPQLKPYKPKPDIYVLPLGGKTALIKFGNKTTQGPHAWLLRRLVSFRYYLDILPPLKALRTWLHSSKVFMEND